MAVQASTPRVALPVFGLLLLLCCGRVAALTKLLEPGCGAGVVLEKCINLASSAAGVGAVGRYADDTDLVKYRKRPTLLRNDSVVAVGADEPGAYTALVRKKSVRFFVEVPPRHDYDVVVGMVDYENCDNGGKGNPVRLVVGSVKTQVNPVLDAGCSTAAVYTVPGVVRSNRKGRIQFKIKGNKPVTVATVCVTRHITSVSSCSTPGCVTFDGCANYAVINASAAIPGEPCDTRPSAFAPLALPPGVAVKRATLQWAGSGFPRGSVTSVTLNGVNVSSTLLYKNGEYEPFYGAVAADVTDIVQRFGPNSDYSVSGIFHRRYHSCPNAHIAAWSLTVVYEALTLPFARVNVCASNTRSTQQQNGFPIGCIEPDVPNVSARSTLVAIETDRFNDVLFVNGARVNFNLFQEYAGDGFDVVSFNLAPFLTAGSDIVNLTFSDNPAHDNLILAVMNTYQTLQ